MGMINRWWPVPAFVGGSIIVQVLTRPHPNPVGHAAGHYGNATVVFAITPVVAITIWASTADLRRRPLFWLLNGLLLAAAAAVYAANMRIVNAIGGEWWSDDQAAVLGPTLPGFEAGHLLTQRAEWAATAIVIVLSLCLGRWHAVRPAVAAAAIVASLILPPWLFPGRGAVVIAIALFHQRAGRLRTRPADPIFA